MILIFVQPQIIDPFNLKLIQNDIVPQNNIFTAKKL